MSMQKQMLGHRLTELLLSRVLLTIESRVTPIDQLATDVLRQPNVECKCGVEQTVRKSSSIHSSVWP